MSSWTHPRAGIYKRTEGSIDGLVMQEGELWKSIVYLNGEEVDRGEWDGRGIALANAYGAMMRARSLRSEAWITRDQDGDEED